MKSYNPIILILCFIFTLSSYAQSVPMKGHECSGEHMVSSMNCYQPVTENSDVRLYIDEFQTCKDGNIVELRRSILALNIDINNGNRSGHSVTSDLIDINYSPLRILIDEKNRGDNLSFNLPTDAVIHDQDSVINMTISNQSEPDYHGADTFHFVGSFTRIDSNGVVKSGALNCSVNR